MNIPMSWLKEFVDIDVDLKTFEHEMTMSGSNVELINSIGKEINKVVVGKIISIERHPDADKLVIAQVKVGEEKTIQIVTGAKNISEGAFIPVALHGATLAGGLKIKNTKLRGVQSEGMMCSIEDLGYTNVDYPEAPEDGVYIFNTEHPLGADVCEILQIKEDIVEFEITSNRPDCYSVIGMAREVSATFSKKLNINKIKVKENLKEDINSIISVDIHNSEMCKRYVSRVIKNVKVEHSPQWIRRRLTACGIRPINNIVDITNYVMLEYGQPLHAYNMEYVENGNIIVRNATEGETIETLDGITRKLNSKTLIISDTVKPLAIAGIMGGKSSNITESTNTVLIESANFTGTNIRLTSKALGLRTDSSSKYEKGLDPNISIQAVNRCMELIEMIGCGEVVEGVVDIYPSVVEGFSLPYSPENINKLLGTNISSFEMENILNRVFIKSNNNVAYIPSFRSDIKCEADIAEEVIRLYGFDNIVPTLATSIAGVGKKTYKQQIDDIILETATSLGLCQIFNYSFESPKVFKKLNIPEDSDFRKTVNIKNPLGEDFSIMKTSTINGMLQSLSLNYNRRNEEASLFEISKVYIPKSLPLKELPQEKMTLTIGMYDTTNTKKDFYNIKGIVESIFKTLGMEDDVEYSLSTNYSFMHPGRTASIDIKGNNIGYLGEVHPLIQKNYEIDTRVYVAVLDIELIYKTANLIKNYKPLPKYPSIVRDIAILVKDEICVKDIENVIKENSNNILENVKFFDVYKGNQIEEGYKSVAYSITFRDKEKTLTDDQVSLTMKKILKSLESKLGAKQR